MTKSKPSALLPAAAAAVGGALIIMVVVVDVVEVVAEVAEAEDAVLVELLDEGALAEEVPRRLHLHNNACL